MKFRLGKLHIGFGDETKAYSAPTSNSPLYPKYNSPQTYNDETVVAIYKSCSAIVACMRVLQYSFWEPPLRTYKDSKLYPNERIQTLLDYPNPDQSQSELMSTLITYLVGGGNAFMLKARGKSSKLVKELWVYAEDSVNVKLNESTGVVSHYELSLRGKSPVRVEKDDMIHFKSPMVDPERPYMGISALRLLAREAGVDSALTRFLRAYINKGATPGTVAFPDFAQTGEISPEEITQFKQEWIESFGGDNNGAPAILNGIKDVKTLVPPIKDFNTDSLRYFSENRVCAAIGVPAEVAGLGSGKESSTYDNVKSARQMLYDLTVVPLWKGVQDKLTVGLAREIDNVVEIQFDLSRVEALRLKRLEESAKYADTIFKYQQLYYGGGIDADGASNAIQYLTGLSKDEADILFIGKVFVTPIGSLTKEATNG